MSERAPAWFEQKNIAGVNHQIQAVGNILDSTARPADRVEALTVKWKTAGSGEATERSRADQDATVMNADRGMVEATMQDWEANDWIDIYDLTKMTENEQQVVQKTGAMAIGRRLDKIQIGAMDAAAGDVATIGDGTAAVDPTVFMAARDRITDIGVGSYEIYCGIPVNQSSQLALYKEYAHADWAGPDHPLLKQIGARTVWGINFIPLPSSYFKVTVAGSVDAYLWVKDCVGRARAMEARNRIDYIPLRKKWFCAYDLSSTAKVIDPVGVKRLRFLNKVNDAAPLTRPTN